ncbi:MAG TPA: argininosuccinate lyase [Bryobacteraceae bacterium]|nr:argininosuccinate lyase [Bryobacteraceae bacterium]
MDPFPAPVYAETVLVHNFEDAKKYFLGALLEIHYAHTRMLAGCGLLTRAEESKLLAALHGLDRNRIASARFDGRCEDLFFFVEGLLEEAAGRELAGKMHTARSRNDIAVTLYRMAARREILATARALAEVRAVLLALATPHIMTVMPAHTHTQPAQPTTLAHYLLAAVEFLARDTARIQAAFARVNLSPMGAAAITTSGFPIDRDATARFLGFDGLAENSYGAIAAIDYITETAAAVAVAMVNIGKLVQDLLLWSTREFGFLRLADAFVQSSSIMPQKRNPVALEHVRILASRALGEAQAVLTCAHNTPFGDVNDSEDDLQPLVFTMFADARRALLLLAGALKTAQVDTAVMADRARRDFLTVTELADTLVRREGLSFREAHALVSEAVRACGPRDDPSSLAEALRKSRPALQLTQQEIERCLDPEHFVQVRNVRGGPAPEQTSAELERAAAEQGHIKDWIASTEATLDAARAAATRIP